MEMIPEDHTEGSHGLSKSYFQGQQELLRESLLTDPTGGMYVIDELSNAAHEGTAFSVSQDGTIAIGASAVMLGRTTDKEVHFHGFDIFASDGNFTVHLYEAPTTTADGTPVSAVNRRRNSPKVSTMSVFGAPTVTDNGLTLEHAHVFGTGSQGSHISGGIGGITADWVLKANTDYLIGIENLSGAILSYTANFIWAERDVIV